MSSVNFFWIFNFSIIKFGFLKKFLYICINNINIFIMSRKIKISISNNRPNLSLLFHQYIDRKSKEVKIPYRYEDDDDYDYESMAEYWDKVFPGWDDDGESLYPLVREGLGGKRSKRGSRGKMKHRRNKKGKKLFDIDVPYSGYEDDPTEYGDDYDDGDYQSKTIWFYPDYHDKDDKLEFNSLKSFDKYCSKMGYNVPSYVANDIIYRSESHCCLNTLSEKDGILEIMSAHSYGEMFYDACDTSELGQ